MYLHLGQDVVVREDSVIGIFDSDNTTGSSLTRDFLNRAERGGRVVNISSDIPKSFVVCREGEADTIYLSQLSPATLLKRSGSTVPEFNFVREAHGG